MNTPDPFREHADLIRAIEERPLTGEIKVPQHVLYELEEKLDQARKQAAPSIRAGRRLGWGLRIAVVLALLLGVTWLWVPTTPPTAQVVITSPGDEITDTRPTIAWNSKDPPGQKYDVWILPAEGDHLTTPALFVAKNTTSPVDFSQLQPSEHTAMAGLQPGTDYRVLVCLADAGRMAGVPIPFKVKTTR